MPQCKTRCTRPAYWDTRQRMSNWSPSWCRSASGLRFGPWCSMGNVLLVIRTTGWASSPGNKNSAITYCSNCRNVRFLPDFCYKIWEFTITTLVTSGISGHAHLTLLFSGRGHATPQHHQAMNNIFTHYTQNIPSARQLCNKYEGHRIFP